MKPNIDHVEIKEPPLENIKKKRSCLKQSCWSGCGCLFFICIGLIVLLKFVTSPAPRTVERVPAHAAEAVPVYDEDNIHTVAYLSGERRQNSLNILSYAPRLLLVPIVALLDIDVPNDSGEERANPWQRAYAFANGIDIDDRDIVTIEWRQLSADPSFIETFYRKELQKRSFTVEEPSTGNGIEFIFHKEHIDGTVWLVDRPDIDGTDLLTLTVRLPANE